MSKWLLKYLLKFVLHSISPFGASLLEGQVDHNMYSFHTYYVLLYIYIYIYIYKVSIIIHKILMLYYYFMNNILYTAWKWLK